MAESKYNHNIYLIGRCIKGCMPEIGEKAPELAISEWVQGLPTTFADERDHVILVEVFQVNCPGCFLYGIPEAINIYNQYVDEGIRVVGVATAFEDYDKNTLENLRVLAEHGTVIGETRRALEQYGQLQNDTLPYKIPFPLGMDDLSRVSGQVDDDHVMAYIKAQLPDFDNESPARRQDIIQRVKNYMRSKEYSAKTFEMYALRGTPSTILVDRHGILRDVSFGQTSNMESKVVKLLRED